MVKASLSSISAPHFDENAGYPGPTPQDELAADLEQHIKETLVKEPAAPTLAGSGEPSPELKIHHDEPAIDPTLAERIRIYISELHLADIYIRECDGTACVIDTGGEVVVKIEDELSRHGAISAAAHALYKYLMETGAQTDRLLAARLNAHIAKTIDDPTKIVPAGEACEWPLADEIEPPTDDTTTDDDIDEAGDVVCEGDIDDGSAVNSELVDESLVAPEGEPAVEIVALTEEACGEGGDSEAEETMKRARAVGLYEHALAHAKDRYVEASQHRSGLQESVKSAKKAEAELLETINTIEARGWQAFLPTKKPAPSTGATTTATTTAGPAIPSHESTLPPPEAPFSPQAGVSGANDHPAPPAGDWQSVDIAALNLKKSLATRLREAGHDTIGKLEKLRGQFEGLLSIDGVGRAKADEIEEALLGWLSRNRDAAVLSAAKEKAVAGEGLALEMAAQGQD